MLLCGINEIKPGMCVAASVFHPGNQGIELLRPGAELDSGILRRLRLMNVKTVWVNHDATDDLDTKLKPKVSKSGYAAVVRMKNDFAEFNAKTITTEQVTVYRQLVLEMVCELLSDRNLANVTDRLMKGHQDLFAHCANVALLSIQAAIELEGYIIRQRKHINPSDARDMTAIGMGALLHDIGKLAMPEQWQDMHETTSDFDEMDPEQRQQYFNHTIEGYNLVRDARLPATARQVVLNHHQRMSGEGFPDLTEISNNRIQGPQSNEQVHIFCRIVGAANALDNLLKQAENNNQPTISAMRTFADQQFDGWFDPVIRDLMLRRFPPFEVGRHVVLSDGRAAVVIAPNLKQPCQPVIRLLQDESSQNDEAVSVIQLDQTKLQIDSCSGQNVKPYLFQLPVLAQIEANLDSVSN